MTSGGRYVRCQPWGYDATTPPQSACAGAAIVAKASAASRIARRHCAKRLSTGATISMLFPTVQFAIFFPLVLGLNWLLMPRPWFWKPFIVVASYAFYAAANWRFCFLLGGVTLWNQGASQLIHRSEDERRRKRIVAAAVVGNLLVLGVFKYYSFFVQDVDRVLDAARMGLPLPLLTIALPVGVSFFTFQAISYTV